MPCCADSAGLWRGSSMGSFKAILGDSNTQPGLKSTDLDTLNGAWMTWPGGVQEYWKHKWNHWTLWPSLRNCEECFGGILGMVLERSEMSNMIPFFKSTKKEDALICNPGICIKPQQYFFLLNYGLLEGSNMRLHRFSKKKMHKLIPYCKRAAWFSDKGCVCVSSLNFKKAYGKSVCMYVCVCAWSSGMEDPCFSSFVVQWAPEDLAKTQILEWPENLHFHRLHCGVHVLTPLLGAARV